jgi:hypothetical protein
MSGVVPPLRLSGPQCVELGENPVFQELWLEKQKSSNRE